MEDFLVGEVLAPVEADDQLAAVRRKAGDGQLDLTVANVDLVGHCLLVVLMLVLADDDL